MKLGISHSIKFVSKSIPNIHVKESGPELSVDCDIIIVRINQSGIFIHHPTRHVW